jgi:paraquat-inducible protein B
MAKLNGIMDDVEQGHLPEQAAATLVHAGTAMQELASQLDALEAAELSKAVQKSLGTFDATLSRVNHLLDRVESDDGLLASTERAMTSIGELARGSHSIGPELESTMREVRGAARSIRRFADTLERDPDMLLKGRAQRE